MALVVEDGSLIAGANSFVTRAEIITYAGDRGVALPNDETTDVLGIKAMDFLWTVCLKGVQVGNLPFPRSGLVDGDDVDGYAFTIPYPIKQAQCQLALDVASGVELTPSAAADGFLKRSKVGPIEEEFFAPNTQTLDGSPPLRVALAWLDPYLCADRGMGLKTLRA